MVGSGARCMRLSSAKRWRWSMADDLIAIPRRLLEQMLQALDGAVDSNVTIAGLCRLGVDFCKGDSQTLFNAIDSCINLQNHAVRPASNELDRLLSGVRDG